MAEHWRNNAFYQAVGKYVFQLKFNLTGIFAQWNKMPMPGQLLKRAIHERDIHVTGKLFVVAGGEVLSYAMIADVDSGLRHLFGALDHVTASTPRQKAGVIFYGIHQLKHGFTGVHDQYGFFYLSHY